MSRRMDRVNVLLRHEISRVLSREMNDPRLARLVSVTEVDSSADLRHAKVYVSVLGEPSDKRSTLDALKSASGYIHRTIRPKLALRNVPHLVFYLDESIEQGAELLEKIKQALPPNDDNE